MVTSSFDKKKEFELARDILDQLQKDIIFASPSRSYTVNVFGYGNQGKQVVRELGQFITHPKEYVNNIEKVNVLLRSKKEDVVRLAREEFNTQFNFLTIENQAKYKELQSIMNFVAYDDLKDLEWVVNESRNDDRASTINLFLTRHDDIRELVTRRDNNDNLVIKSWNELQGQGVSYLRDVLPKMMITSGNVKQDVLRLQEEFVRTHNYVMNWSNTHPDAGERINMLSTNAIGVRELGFALKGIKGTNVVFTNDNHITPYILGASADLSSRCVFGSASNDTARLVSTIIHEYQKFVGDANSVPDVKVFHIAGSHGEGVQVSPKHILINGSSLDDMFGDDALLFHKVVLENTRRFGMHYKHATNKTADDSVYNSLMYVIKGLTQEVSDWTYRGSVLHEEYGTMMGLNFSFKNGSIHADSSYITNLDAFEQNKLFEQARLTNNFIAGLIKNGITPKWLDMTPAPKIRLRKARTRGNVLSDLLRDVESIKKGQQDLGEKITIVQENVNVKFTGLGRSVEQGFSRMEVLMQKQYGSRLSELEKDKRDEEAARRAIEKGISANIYFVDKENNTFITRASFKNSVTPIFSNYRLINYANDSTMTDSNLTRKSDLNFLEPLQDGLLALIKRSVFRSNDYLRAYFINLRDSSVNVLTDEFSYQAPDFKVIDIVKNNDEVFALTYHDGRNFLQQVDYRQGRCIDLMPVSSSVKHIKMIGDDLFLFQNKAIDKYIFSDLERNVVQVNHPIRYPYSLAFNDEVVVVSSDTNVWSAIDINSSRCRIIYSDNMMFDTYAAGNSLSVLRNDDGKFAIDTYVSKEDFFSGNPSSKVFANKNAGSVLQARFIDAENIVYAANDEFFIMNYSLQKPLISKVQRVGNVIIDDFMVRDV